jgi:hypothetical protein
MHSSPCGGELSATVEATPPGLGRWDLLWFAAPFLGAGFHGFTPCAGESAGPDKVAGIRNQDHPKIISAAPAGRHC